MIQRAFLFSGKNKKHEHGKKIKKMLYDPNKTKKWACVISVPLTSTSSPCLTLRAGRGWRLAGRFEFRRSDWLPERWLSNPKRKHEKKTLAYVHKLKPTQKYRKSEKKNYIFFIAIRISSYYNHFCPVGGNTTKENIVRRCANKLEKS